MLNRINKFFLYFLVFFNIISILAIYSAAMYTSKSLGNLVLKQTFWYILGFVVIWFVIKIKNSFLHDHAFYFYIIGIFLLLLLLVIGVPINNSKCWLTIPGVGSFQPSEFMKIFITLVLSNLIYSFKKNTNNPTISEEFIFILKCFFIVLVPSFLTFLQPDTGAIMIYLVIFIFMMFISGIRLRWFLFALLFLGFIVSICGGIYIFNESLFVELFGTSVFYRIERLFMWKDGVGLQLENAIASIGSSGFWGHGFNNVPIYFPEASTDFIFAVFATCFGFLGVLFFLLGTLVFDLFILSLIKNRKNSKSKYVLVGILGMILFQQIQNIGMTIGLFPIMGITLPFISYGGSSLVSYMIIIGILVNISSEKIPIYN